MITPQLPKIIKKGASLRLLQNSDEKFIKKAFRFAEEAHRGQKRASGEDYISHPLRVSQILSEMDLDSKTIAAGLLHDVIDDTPRTAEDIEKEFGKEVSFLVQGVTKLGKLRYPKEELEVKSMEARIEKPIDLRAENLRKMFFAMGEDLRVVLIKLADRLHNMETLRSLPPEKQQRIALETLEIFAPLADRLGIGEVRAKLRDLAFSFLYPKEYEWLMKNVKEKYEARQKYLERITPVLKDFLKKEKIKPVDVHSRAKSYWSLYQKLLKNEMNFDKIHDLVALRIIVKDVSSCYKTLGTIHKYWKPLPEKIHDFIALPKPNGYRGLHTTCFCLDGKITEFQIKTEEMHDEAENGICAHWAYKEGINLGTQGGKFTWVKQLQDWQKEVSKSKEFLEGLRIDFFKNRIFVFTPRGDVIDLPEGATPVDFAYTVHTEIGNKCAGAKINSKMAALSQPLKNGDVVEVIVDKNKKPSRAWLEFVKTSIARSKIKNWLKQADYPADLNAGIKILDDAFRQLRGISFNSISQKDKEALVKNFSYKNIENLIVAVGEGELSPKEVVRCLFKESDILAVSPKIRPSLNLGKTQKILKGVSLAGEKGLQIYLAKCCLPQPGEEIKAYVTKTKGAAVHRATCENMIAAEKKWPQKIVEASWLTDEKFHYAVFLEIEADDRIGLTKDISTTINAMNVNILNYRAEPKQKEKALIRTQIEIAGLEELEGLFDQLKQVKGVINVRKA